MPREAIRTTGRDHHNPLVVASLTGLCSCWRAPNVHAKPAMGFCALPLITFTVCLASQGKMQAQQDDAASQHPSESDFGQYASQRFGECSQASTRTCGTE